MAILLSFSIGYSQGCLFDSYSWLEKQMNSTNAELLFGPAGSLDKIISVLFCNYLNLFHAKRIKEFRLYIKG